MSLTVVRHRFTVEDYEQMIETGILAEDDRVELIHGEIIAKIPVSDHHAACVKRLNRPFGKAVGDRAIVRVQNPIRLSDSVPEPDLALLVPGADFYASGRPQPPDIYLIIEVADTSMEYDRELKLPMYAFAGIQEYWIVNLNEQCVEVFWQRRPDGIYGASQTLRPGEQVEIGALAGLVFTVDEIVGI